MIKKMLVNATHPEENRVAIVEDGILSELDIEITGKEQTKGNIYKATVIRVETGLQAAFVDYGAERLGFLQLGELHHSLYPKKDGEEQRRPRIGEILHRGQELLVQITKEERGQKGAALTTFLSLPGRYMVLMPGDKTRGMSRKIPDGAERKQLKQAMAQLELPEEEMGYIIRTAALGQSAEELKRDLNYLRRVYQNIVELSRRVKAPALVYRESNLVIRSLRDYFTPDIEEVLVDDPKVFEEAKDFFQQVMPEYARLVKLHQERRPIFSKYQIEEQIETISHKQILLPSGGSIVIDSTEALVAIDVNSGKLATEQGVEGTAFKTNLEAAEEAARQLRLRDLGGLVVIDFIDMRDRKHIRDVEKRLKDALAKDKARVTVGRISQFGLLEMSRQRIKSALAEGSYLSCPNCKGTGRVKSSEAQAVAFLRRLHATVARGQIERVEGEVPIDVAHYLLNVKREELVDMERRYQVDIFIRARKSFIASQFELIVHKREKEEKRIDESTAPVTASTVLPAEPLPAAQPAADKPREEKPAAEEGAPQAAPTASKSKRRRSRGKGGKTPAAEASSAAEAVPPGAAEEAREPAPPVENEPAEEATVPPAAGAEPSEERKRKRRRRPRSKTKKPADGTVDTAVEQSLAGTDSRPAEAPQSEPPPAAPLEDQSVPPTAGAPDAPAANAPETAAADQPPTPRKTRRPRRKPAAKNAAAAAETPPTGQAPDAASQPPPEAPATPVKADAADSGTPAGEAKKPAPRKRKAPAKKTAAAADQASQPAAEKQPATGTSRAPAATAAKTADQPETPAPQKSPPKRRTRARKPSTPETDTPQD